MVLSFLTTLADSSTLSVFWTESLRSCLKPLKIYSEVIWNKMLCAEQGNDRTIKGGPLFVSVFYLFLAPFRGSCLAVSVSVWPRRGCCGKPRFIKTLTRTIQTSGTQIMMVSSRKEPFWLGFPKIAPPDLVKCSKMSTVSWSVNSTEPCRGSEFHHHERKQAQHKQAVWEQQSDFFKVWLLRFKAANWNWLQIFFKWKLVTLTIL